MYWVLMISLFVAGIAQAGGINLTASGAQTTINGAIFEVILPTDSSGSVSDSLSFLRISSSAGIIRGYNTDYRPLQFEENNSASLTHSFLLSEVPQIEVDSTL